MTGEKQDFQEQLDKRMEPVEEMLRDLNRQIQNSKATTARRAAELDAKIENLRKQIEASKQSLH
ncbi:MAG TPA: hypothetical protein VMH87_07855 [Pseudomonadales bacterium]|nr:hypothetical protein [Pseudomonadales bacterium]